MIACLQLSEDTRMNDVSSSHGVVDQSSLVDYKLHENVSEMPREVTQMKQMMEGYCQVVHFWFYRIVTSKVHLGSFGIASLFLDQRISVRKAPEGGGRMELVSS